MKFSENKFTQVDKSHIFSDSNDVNYSEQRDGFLKNLNFFINKDKNESMTDCKKRIKKTYWCYKNIKGFYYSLFYLRKDGDDFKLSFKKIFHLLTKLCAFYSFLILIFILFLNVIFSTNVESGLVLNDFFTLWFLCSAVVFIILSLCFYFDFKIGINNEDGLLKDRFEIYERVMAGKNISIQELAEKGLLKIPGEK